jgi:hypothetical protein
LILARHLSMPSFLTRRRSTLITGAVASALVVAAAASAAAIVAPSGSAMASAGAAGASPAVVTAQHAVLARQHAVLARQHAVLAREHAVARAGQGDAQTSAQRLVAFDRVRFSLGELQYENDVAIAKAAAKATAAQAARAAAAKAAAAAAARTAAAGTAAAQETAAQAAPAQETAAQSSATSTSSGSPEQIAQQMLGQFGWSASQFSCLYPLWEHESGWNPAAENPGSGAYGIPQALPGSMMASAGADWQTNPATQIKWGLTYIQSRYGSPCGAWAHEQADNWY